MDPRFSENKTFHASATLWRFALWAAAAAAGAFFAERHALSLPSFDSNRWIFHALCIGGLILGPLAFAAQLVRRLRVCVTVLPGKGLVLRDGTEIPWDMIARVDHREGLFRDLDYRPTPENPFARRNLLRIQDSPWLLSARGLILYVSFVVFYYTLYPVLLTLSPWHPRIVIRCRDRRKLVLRDLQDDREFVFRVRQGMRRSKTAGRD